MKMSDVCKCGHTRRQHNVKNNDFYNSAIKYGACMHSTGKGKKWKICNCLHFSKANKPLIKGDS